MTVARGEQRARHKNGQVELGPGGQMPGVDVAGALGRRQDVDRPFFVGRHAHGSAKRRDGDVHDVAGVDLDHGRQRVVPLVVELVASDLVFTHSGSDAHLRTSSVTSAVMGTALARSTFLSNLPTDVFGTSSMKRTSSGSHHLATLSRRKSISSSWVTCPLNSGRGTA